MTTDVDKVALTIFVAFFVLVTVTGFIAARWRRPKTLARLDEWGLGGRQFGTWITWFLVGGDFYTAYTVIAVPALVYAVGVPGQGDRAVFCSPPISIYLTRLSPSDRRSLPSCLRTL